MIFRRKFTFMTPVTKKPSTKKTAKSVNSPTKAKEQKTQSLVHSNPSGTSIVPAKSSRISSTTDALKAYLHDIRKIPSMSAEEEIDLAKRLHLEGDIQAAKLLVSAN